MSEVAEAVFSVVCPDIVRRVAVVVAKVEVPTTVRVPCEVRELVKIPSVARSSAVKKDPVEVALVKDAATALKKVAKRLVLVLLVVEPLVEEVHW